MRQNVQFMACVFGEMQKKFLMLVIWGGLHRRNMQKVGVDIIYVVDLLMFE